MRRMLIAMAAVLAWPGLAQAAEIQAVNSRCFLFDNCEDNNPDSILIRGTITQGDAERFRNVVKQNSPLVTTVILRSNGGNVHEAIKIGRDIRRLLLETEGPLLDYYSNRDGSLSY